MRRVWLILIMAPVKLPNIAEHLVYGALSPNDCDQRLHEYILLMVYLFVLTHRRRPLIVVLSPW